MFNPVNYSYILIIFIRFSDFSALFVLVCNTEYLMCIKNKIGLKTVVSRWWTYTWGRPKTDTCRVSADVHILQLVSLAKLCTWFRNNGQCQCTTLQNVRYSLWIVRLVRNGTCFWREAWFVLTILVDLVVLVVLLLIVQLELPVSLVLVLVPALLVHLEFVVVLNLLLHLRVRVLRANTVFSCFCQLFLSGISL